ncbi:hypothetical protein CTAM01_02690 [Colletotrichum tamarilloi]|uniref:C2H2-type domain-containing protein n=1 Tax=Colletotrichum tamarilloi TaxID=1209934 RepID=A0ABQ9RM82_9PEZI|nr:uncharacterized protein CTAM01_02690 [Colletotrichum tamarilloi]KAK1507578.1 hypothetical protein CTAM01_02690 [Colletotrichum tamarilloi]
MILHRALTLSWAMAAALTESVGAAPIDSRQFYSRMTIGYRTVSAEQARQYNRDGRISFDPARALGNQIGVGVYTTPGPGQWPGNPGDWYCQITARKSKMKSIDKIWIPRDYWWNIGGMYDYVESNFPSIDLDYSMRLSLIADYEHLTQLLIPTYLLSGQGLDIQVTFAFETKTFNCSLCSGRFAILEQSNQHLKSPKHQQNVYCCPGLGCPKELSTLAAVTELLQSEGCNIMTFEAVQETAARMFHPRRTMAL